MSLLNTVFLYLDPGTGSLLVQFIIAAVAGAAFFIGSMRKKIKTFINRFMKRMKEK